MREARKGGYEREARKWAERDDKTYKRRTKEESREQRKKTLKEQGAREKIKIWRKVTEPRSAVTKTKRERERREEKKERKERAQNKE